MGLRQASNARNITRMSQFIDKATPLTLAMFLSVIGIAAALISEASNILAETDQDKRRSMASLLLLTALAPNLCLGAFSFDIWAITTLFSAEQKALTLYNLAGKSNAIQLLLVVHLFLYLLVLAWGGVVRGPASGSGKSYLFLEPLLGILAVVLCVVFQAY
jgi:hypothetical protein